jgi:hypothetical protein
LAELPSALLVDLSGRLSGGRWRLLIRRILLLPAMISQRISTPEANRRSGVFAFCETLSLVAVGLRCGDAHQTKTI